MATAGSSRNYFLNKNVCPSHPEAHLGEFHDRGDPEWIVIRGQLRGHNDTPFGRPTPGQPIGRPGVSRPLGVFGGLNYY
jgi:hypothetical protein